MAAANPLAVDAGLEILAKGGKAIDAAVAVQAMLGLVEPQSSGIGGGAFLMYYDAHTGKVSALDGREKAPAGAPADMFLDEHGKPLPFFEAVRSGRSTGVPGVIAMLAAAHKKLGALHWKELFEPAIRAASAGLSRARAAGDVPRRRLALSADQRGADAVLAARWRDAAGRRPVPEPRVRAHAAAHCAARARARCMRA